MKNITTARRICILGSSGSGKSYLAIRLGEHLSIPVIHMDKLFWQPGWTYLPPKAFSKRVLAAMHSGSWITDGNYSANVDLIEHRLKNSDLVIFIDMDVNECIRSVRARHGTHRPDFPDFLQETPTDLGSLIDHIKHWHAERKHQIIDMIAKLAPNKHIVLRGRAEVDKFLEEL